MTAPVTFPISARNFGSSRSRRPRTTKRRSARVPFNFTTGNPTTLDTAAGYNYIKDLITYLNENYGYLNPAFTPPDTNVTDPLDTLLPDQAGALNGDSSVTPQTGPNINYNYAIARVRLKGTAASLPASNVKVYFRAVHHADLRHRFHQFHDRRNDGRPQRHLSSHRQPIRRLPLPGTDGAGNINGCSLPFFATANFDNDPTDYDAGGPTTKPSPFPAARITPGRSLDVSSTSTMQRTNLAIQPAHLAATRSSTGSPAAPTTAWWRRSTYQLLPSRTSTA